MSTTRYIPVKSCKSCLRCVGRISCSLAGRDFDSGWSTEQPPPDWCPLDAVIHPPEQQPLITPGMSVHQFEALTAHMRRNRAGRESRTVSAVKLVLTKGISVAEASGATGCASRTNVSNLVKTYRDERVEVIALASLLTQEQN